MWEHLKLFLVQGPQSGSVRVTPTNLDGGTYATLDAVGDTVVFLFNDSAWQIIGGYGHAVT